jgi:hypothetical protein
MIIHTIGFTQKSAEAFLAALSAGDASSIRGCTIHSCQFEGRLNRKERSYTLI